MQPRSIAINASNLHVGGGVQVAASVVAELARITDLPPELSIVVSSEVNRNIPAIPHELSKRIHVLDERGALARNRRVTDLLRRTQSVFTVFGPLYRWKPSFRHVVGFARPWIIYPDNEAAASQPRIARHQLRATGLAQLAFFKQADVVVVELDHVKRALVESFGFDSRRVEVVHNCVSSLYADESCWQPIAPLTNSTDVRLGYVGRDYLHKNTRIFPELVRYLSESHGVTAKVFVTFTEQEWRDAGETFRRSCVNVGPLTAAQCPSFYQALDGVVFPSLLECSSATPLEAMAMKVPLFASDRHFNREICAEHAHYFDPMSAEHAASVIAGRLRPKKELSTHLAAARTHALSFQSPSRRARQYLGLLAETSL